jgi:hypothetical protein
MAKSTFALPLSVVVLALSSLLVTGQERIRVIREDPPQPRVTPPSGNSTHQPSESLSTNYRIKFSGKSGETSLGELTSLTCSKSVYLSGPLSASDTPATFTVSGTLDEKDGLIIFNYAIDFRAAVVRTPQTSPPGMPLPPDLPRSITYESHSSKGTLKMKPEKTYDLLRTGGNVYSVVVAPEAEK